MPDELTVTSSKPLPDLTVKNSAPIPKEVEAGFWAHVGQSLKGMVPTEAPGMAENILGPIVPAVKSLVGAGQEAIAAHQRGHGLPYSAAAGASTLVGVNPERMEAAAEKGDTAGVLGEAAVPTALALSPLVMEGAVKGVKAALPSTAHAGEAFAEVKGAAGDIPINMEQPGNTALQLYEQSQRGASLPKVVRDFVKRATTPEAEPITYSEAKDFQSNVSALSADERMSLKPNTKRLLGQLNSDLKASLEDAADTVGKGEQFSQAMKEYHNAMRLKGFTGNAIKAGWAAAATAAGVAGIKKMWDLIP